MTIEDLLISLTTYILRYHDSQPNNKSLIPLESNPELLREKFRAYALKTLENTEVKYNEYLTGLIKEGEKDYTGRLPLLFYILNEIKVIKSIVDRTASFSPTELEGYKKQMTQMLIDLRQLVITIKGATYNVKYSSIIQDGKENREKSISLSGTASYSYLTGHSLCTSGSLLTEEVLKRFNITTTSSDKHIQNIAEELCQAKQNALLVPELLLKIMELTNSQKETIASLLLSIQSKETTIQEQSSSIAALTEQLETFMLSAKDKPLTSEPSEDVESLKLRLKQAEARIEELQEANLSQEKTIANLKKGVGNPLVLGYAYSTLFGLNGPRYSHLRPPQDTQLNPTQEPSTQTLSFIE